MGSKNPAWIAYFKQKEIAKEQRERIKFLENELKEREQLLREKESIFRKIWNFIIWVRRR